MWYLVVGVVCFILGGFFAKLLYRKAIAKGQAEFAKVVTTVATDATNAAKKA